MNLEEAVLFCVGQFLERTSASSSQQPRENEEGIRVVHAPQQVKSLLLSGPRFPHL